MELLKTTLTRRLLQNVMTCNLGGIQIPEKNGLTLVKKTLTTTTLDINLFQFWEFCLIKSALQVFIYIFLDKTYDFCAMLPVNWTI